MSGVALMVIGTGLVLMSTVLFLIVQSVLRRKKRYLKEKEYQIYD